MLPALPTLWAFFSLFPPAAGLSYLSYNGAIGLTFFCGRAPARSLALTWGQDHGWGERDLHGKVVVLRFHGGCRTAAAAVRPRSCARLPLWPNGDRRCFRHPRQRPGTVPGLR